MNDYASLLIGVICAAAGGELFIRGSVGLAHWMRIPPGIIGATVAAFATSSPELSVSISAARSGQPQISLGDALGSNVVNVALILAMALLISGIQSSRGAIKRDFPVAAVVPILTLALAWDGNISRMDGFLMLVIFLGWLAASIREARNERNATDEVLGEARLGRAIFSCAFGLAFLFGAGHFIVAGARGIAVSLGLDEFVIGATIVAVGTSVPELATTVIAKLRGHDEIGLGTVLGSNIFNGILIVPIAAVICPIVVDWREVSVALFFGLISVVCVFPPSSGFIGRARGGILLALYVAYLFLVLMSAQH